MIKTLNGIRFFLFICILLTHIKYMICATPIGLKYFNIVKNSGEFAVTFFFILSGFCIAQGYSEKFSTCTKSKLSHFYKKRFLKSYPLYFITGILMLLFFHILNAPSLIQNFIVLYIPMISSWTNVQYSGGNEAAWFIQVIFLCYLFTPLLLSKLSKIKNSKSLYVIALFLLITLAIICHITKILNLQNAHYNYLYHFPPIRMIHYILGIIIGIIYKKHLNIIFKDFHPKAIIISILDIFIVTSIIYALITLPKHFITTNIIFVPIIILSIFYLSLINSGLLYQILTSKVAQSLGNISLECYLIHYFIVQICSATFFPTFNSNIGIIYYILVMLGTTILVSYMYSDFKQKHTKVLIKLVNKIIK